MLLRRDLPQLLEADAELLRLAALVEAEAAISCLDEEPRAPSANSVYLARSSMPRREVGPCARRPCRCPCRRWRRRPPRRSRRRAPRPRKARIDLDAQRLGLGREPAADVAERDDVVAVVRHQRRHQEIRQPQRAGRPEPVEAVVGDRGLERGRPRCASRAAAGRGRSDRSPRRTGCARRPRSPSRPPRREIRARAASAGSRRRARPGPAPTITTSYSIASRAGGVFGHGGLRNFRCRRNCPGRDQCPSNCPALPWRQLAADAASHGRRSQSRHDIAIRDKAVRELLAFYQEAGVDAARRRGCRSIGFAEARDAAIGDRRRRLAATPVPARQPRSA